MGYEEGWQDGYEAYRRGFTSEFRCKNNPPRVVDLHDRAVDPSLLDFARGHMDGWMRACDDEHD